MIKVIQASVFDFMGIANQYDVYVDGKFKCRVTYYDNVLKCIKGRCNKGEAKAIEYELNKLTERRLKNV